MNRNFFGLGFENSTFNADNVTNIPFLEGSIILFPYVVALYVKLDIALFIGKVAECLTVEERIGGSIDK